MKGGRLFEGGAYKIFFVKRGALIRGGGGGGANSRHYGSWCKHSMLLYSNIVFNMVYLEHFDMILFCFYSLTG